MSTSRDDGSITRDLGPLRAGDPDGMRRLWEAYYRRVVGLARTKLCAASRGAADEEDVALSVFDSLFRRAGRGEFDSLEDRDDLWQVLFVLTVRKAANLNKRSRRLKRGGGAVLPLSELGGPGVGGLAGPGPAPELAAQVVDECRRLLDLLGDDTLRRLAQRKLEGYTNAEIASELGCVEATVERKVKRIRELWADEVGP